MPNAILESMDCERLLVVTESADNDGIISHGVNCLYYPENDHQALAKKLKNVQAMEQAEQIAMERRA
jgi:hypothetical protein